MDFISDVRSANLSALEMIWHTRSLRAGSFISEAASHWELVITKYNGQTTITARGPETRASQADFPAAAEFFGITFKLGAYMPHLPVINLLDRNDITLPQASSRAFWLHGSAWEMPTYENADVFIKRLVRQGILVRDPLVEAAVQGHMPALSLRALQYRIKHATGLTHKTIEQIERARRAATLLRQGKPILDTAVELGYFDQAHLTNMLKRFMGRTPAQVARTPAVP